VLEPGPQHAEGEFTEPLGIPGESDTAVGQVEVVEGGLPDRRGAGGVADARATISRCAGFTTAAAIALISLSVNGISAGSTLTALMRMGPSAE
jgi:hypothetical protein